MSGSDSNPLKNPLYWLVKQDSRAASEVGRAVNWDYLKDEGKRNQANPGRAITKAGEAAAAYYLGGLLGGAEGAGAGTAADESAGLSMAAPFATQAGALAGQTGTQLGQQAMQQVFQDSMESALPDTGYTPSSLRYAFQNANSANGTPLGQNLANWAGQKQTDLMNGALFNTFKANATGSMGKQLALKTGTDMMSPHGAPQQAPMMHSQAPQGPMPSPYSNSLGGPSNNMSEAEKRYYRSLGYNV